MRFGVALLLPLLLLCAATTGGCANLVGAAIGTATGANSGERRQSPGERALAQQAEWDHEKYYGERAQSAACFGGTTESSGIFGRRLERVNVDIEITIHTALPPPNLQEDPNGAIHNSPPAGADDDLTIRRTTQTDLKGGFHVCLEKHDMGELGALMVGGKNGQYQERSARLRITFSRVGYATKTIEREVATSNPRSRLDVILDVDHGVAAQ